IKRIQRQTPTYIVTPSRDKEPVFEVTGMPENVDRAREEIEAHITMRTGSFIDVNADNDFHSNGTDVCLDLPYSTSSGFFSEPPAPLGAEQCDFGFDFLALDLTTPTTIWSPFERSGNPLQAFSSCSSIN
ncbi:PREDICTED: RNA-binding protein MEX3D-like, partial [Pterocles gutturalis]|uniref:RNA-binding protein MEX3D-like n=1 Tax=Pterocles gutturalis TaxID=240206 RepID=UPI00052865F8